MSEDRPNPDSLLAQVNESEKKQSRGRLKIFFGAAPGVGKTYAMLEEGRKRAGEGMDVVVGYAEPHARVDTEAMLIGMDILPYKIAEYRNSKLKEFDLDAALARRPHLILVDELAHTNAPGLRHQKRWQDVVELLDAGIHVYTTLNVQHLESVNDIVEKISGVKVRETLPDAVLEQADEIEMIDTAPEELLERFREGKIYRPEQAERATRHFFNKGNLIALRELALRRTAERVDAQMQDFRRENLVNTTWAASERILVCVGPSPLSARLVRSAKRLAAGLKAPWIAAYVESASSARWPEEVRKRLEANLQLAEQLGAEVVRLTGEGISEEITAYAKTRNVTKIVIGKPDRPRWRERLSGSSVDELIRNSGEIDVYVIRGDADGSTPAVTRAIPTMPTIDTHGIIAAIASVALTTAIGWPMYHYLALANSNVLMLYLLCVLWIATRYERVAAAAASLLGVLAFDFFFVPPEYSFSVSDRQYVFTFGVMLFTALLISTLTHRIRLQVEASRLRERRTAILYGLSRELASAKGAEQIAGTTKKHFIEAVGMPSILLVPDQQEQLISFTSVNTTVLEKELGTAQWVYEHGQPAGHGTSTLPSAEHTYLPLTGSTGVLGVLAIRYQEDAPRSNTEQRQLVEAMASQVAQAIERTKLAEEARIAWEKVESEFLRNTLLSGVSHELRTPLASITGALSTAVDPNSSVDAASRQELLDTALSEAERMDRLINNLLDMTRLESGGLKLNRDWHAIPDLIGSAVKHMDRLLRGRSIHTQLPPELPLMRVDGLAIEQVLMNLLDNAVKYTPIDSQIDVTVSMINSELAIDISDRGPGLPPGTEHRVFEKFFRAHASSGRGGIGLGLAICRGIVNAHQGEITAFNRSGGGATFRIKLPVESAPTVDATN